MKAYRFKLDPFNGDFTEILIVANNDSDALEAAMNQANPGDEVTFGASVEIKPGMTLATFTFDHECPGDMDAAVLLPDENGREMKGGN